MDAGKVVIDGLYRYSILEMRMPKKNVKAKVDTNKNNSKRILSSAGNYRKREISDFIRKKSSG